MPMRWMSVREAIDTFGRDAMAEMGAAHWLRRPPNRNPILLRLYERK